MAAADNIHPQLFHGTAGSIRGGIVSAGNAYDYGIGNNYAYSTPDRAVASRMARHRADEEGRLFGAVYEVEPLSQRVTPEGYGGSVEYRDPKGYKVLKEIESPINLRAV